MKKTGEKQIRRHSDGSIDTTYYQAAGRLKRSQQCSQLLSLVRRFFQGVRLSFLREADTRKASRPI